MTGRFITFEGGEGSGKSTQLKLLGEALEREDIPFVLTREPGGSRGAEQVRSLLVSGDPNAWDPVSETLLFTAARVDHVRRTIQPALEDGVHVLCDRFFDSTLVYQGIGKNLGEEYVTSLHRLALGSFGPDLTLIFDIDPQAGLERAFSRRGPEARFEAMPLDFHHAVRAGFQSLASRNPQRCVVIDASERIEDVHAAVLRTLSSRLGWKFA